MGVGRPRPRAVGHLRVADAIFEKPRLAEIYDALDPDRTDLDTYLAIVDEFGAGAVVDIGCGTGTWPVSWPSGASK